MLHAWPNISAAVPNATLEVYYGFSKSFMAFGKKTIPNFPNWIKYIKGLLKQKGVHYYGMVDHHTLAHAYARAGFSLYPTSFPETGCVALMKAQALGAIPITSRYANSTLPELTLDWDLGPAPARSDVTIDSDPSMLYEWTKAVIVLLLAPTLQRFSGIGKR